MRALFSPPMADQFIQIKGQLLDSSFSFEIAIEA